nr:immunoglobulin light chain junction region [Macaca mulatta]MOW17878.1 immunoglobulin light chain junction region [Macaca mulatta]MOW18012.1 immunoglobulin light chain junction region [Macaca mulatta]MOW18278.1 immunoglobulin light chain junction region [Macaca mulatta]MOY05407.1 immunoglobulin light chain junction region [Macaca mulatta]
DYYCQSFDSSLSVLF